MSKLYLGKYTNTHGIKGEIKIFSEFEKKELVFRKGFKLIINNQEYIINEYRPHQEYDMVTFEGIENINDIEHLKGKEVYINREDLNLNDNEHLLTDLIGMEILYNNKTIGKIEKIVYNKTNILLSIKGEKSFYIPKQEHFIKHIDLENRIVTVENIEGLI